MADIQEIYSILLARGYQEQLFSSLPGKRKKERGGKETLVDCPICHKEGHFSYSNQRPVWRCWSCGEAGDWIRYLDKVSGYDFQRSLQELAGLAGVELSSSGQANYQTYIKKADILEAAQKYFMDTLQDQKAEEVYKYLLDRGYVFDNIYDLELGAYTDRKALQAELKRLDYTDKEIQASGLLTQGFGDVYKLTLLWRDQSGRATGIVGRSILPGEELDNRGLSKYKYSAGLEKDRGMVGFSSVRGSAQVVIVEGVLDALYLNYQGFKAIAVGGTSLSAAQLQALESTGTRELLLAMDMDDPGQKATEKMIRSLTTSSLRAYVVSLPDGYKDPDELVRMAGAEAFQEALDKAERGSKWLASRIVSRYDLITDRGLDQALEEALDILADLEDKIEAKGFMDSLREATGLSEEDLASRAQDASQKVSARRAQSVLQNYLRDLQEKASQGDITGAEALLARAQRELKVNRGIEPPDPYLLEDLTGDLLSSTPALTTGFQKLDDTARIPTGAITIIAGRPGHGKTTFQLNLLVNMLRAYPGKKFYFFSYEEARKMIATKLIMILAGEKLSSDTNLGAYINYFQEKRGSNKQIEKAILEYEQFTSSGRLLISDRMDPAEDLVSVISQLSKTRDIGAVIVDYIQRIPVQRSQSQRYLDIKAISAMLLEQAVSLDIPIILGAQLGRSKEAGSKVKLDNLRESGDIEQDANLVIGLYTEAVEKLEEEGIQAKTKLDPEVDIQISVLKNRGGIAGRSYTLAFNRPILTITDKTSGARSGSSTY